MKDLPFFGDVNDIEQAQDVLMYQILHDYDFAEDPLCIDQILNV